VQCRKKDRGGRKQVLGEDVETNPERGFVQPYRKKPSIGAQGGAGKKKSSLRGRGSLGEKTDRWGTRNQTFSAKKFARSAEADRRKKDNSSKGKRSPKQTGFQSPLQKDKNLDKHKEGNNRGGKLA